MRRIAGGALDCAIPSIRRADQIGQMARAVQVFKNSMTETERLRAEQEKIKRQAAAEQKAATAHVWPTNSRAKSAIWLGCFPQVPPSWKPPHSR